MFFLLLPLLLQAPVTTNRTVGMTALSRFPFTLPSGYFDYFPIDAFVNGTVVSYSLVSNTSVSTAFMTSAQLQSFNSSNGVVSNSIAYLNGTSSSQTLRVAVGYYDVVVYAYGSSANASLGLGVLPNNPLSFGSLLPPEPSGIASYGLSNQSGIDAPYAVVSTDVIGVAAISSIRAYNATAESAGANPSGATLQLNSVLVVKESGGETQVYWCQNTPDFVTSASQVAFSDNVWNYSVSGFLSNDSITSEGGGGYVSTFQQNGNMEYFYAYEGSNSSYSLPVGMVLLINATAEPGAGVLVQFGVEATGGTQGTPPMSDWFDNVTIHDPAVTSAYFFTAGNYTTPINTFYDTELVFGGEGGGEATSFTQLGATLGLFYANGTSDKISAFPSYFSFGMDTAESADNLMVRYLGNGGASVSTGTPNYDYLGAAAGSYSLSSVENSLRIGNSTTTTSTSMTSTAGGTTTSSGASSTTAGGIPMFPYEMAAAVVFVTFVLVSYFAVRRRFATRELPAPP